MGNDPGRRGTGADYRTRPERNPYQTTQFVALGEFAAGSHLLGSTRQATRYTVPPNTTETPLEDFDPMFWTTPRVVARRTVPVAGILAFLLLPFASPAAAGDEVCPLSQATNDLLSCQHCVTFKDLLTAADQQGIRLTTHEMRHGVVVDLSSDNPEGVARIHELVDRLWITESGTDKPCKGCADRQAKLAKTMRDRALTPRGAFVVLTSQDEAMVRWLHKDAAAQQRYVTQAAHR